MTRGRGQSIGRAYPPNETQYARWGSAYPGHYLRHRPVQRAAKRISASLRRGNFWQRPVF